MVDSSTLEREQQNPYVASIVPEPTDSYRIFNRAAVASVILAVLGLTGIFFQILLLLPLSGLLLGFSGYRTIRRYPEEFTGLNTARLGMVACLLVFTLGVTIHAVTYATEVPENHQRVWFSELQPDGFKAKSLIPQRAVDLCGQKIFIKGYMHPGVSDLGKTDTFVLVPDMGTCCFGGQPKLTDMILVHTDSDSKLGYSRRMLKLAGTFDIGQRFEDFAGVKNVAYRLEATEAK